MLRWLELEKENADYGYVYLHNDFINAKGAIKTRKSCVFEGQLFNCERFMDGCRNVDKALLS